MIQIALPDIQFLWPLVDISFFPFSEIDRISAYSAFKRKEKEKKHQTTNERRNFVFTWSTLLLLFSFSLGKEVFNLLNTSLLILLKFNFLFFSFLLNVMFDMILIFRMKETKIASPFPWIFANELYFNCFFFIILQSQYQNNSMGRSTETNKYTTNTDTAPECRVLACENSTITT